LPPDYQPEQGPTKEIPSQFRRTVVDYLTVEPSGTIIIDTPNRYLYLTLDKGKAIRYGVGVGREGFTWSGTERISRMKEWPDWFPEGDDHAPTLSAAVHGWWRDQSARRARDVSGQYRIPHPRHQSAVNHRQFRILRLHSFDQ
jgi:hypothetical protein